MKRTLLAFGVAAAVPFLIGLLGGLIYAAITFAAILHSYKSAPRLDELFLFIVVPLQLVAPFVLIFLLFFGAPLYGIFQDRRIVSLRAYLIAGVGFSIFALIIEVLLGVVPPTFRAIYIGQVIITAIGTLASGPLATAAFWYVRKPHMVAYINKL